MSTSIRRPRIRPRVKSVNFRSFWWLVTRQAAFQILSELPEGRSWLSMARWICEADSRVLHRWVHNFLRRLPERRYYS